MRAPLFVLAAGFVTLTGCIIVVDPDHDTDLESGFVWDQGLRGSGRAAEQERHLDAFDRIEVSGSIDVVARVETGGPIAVVRGDDNLIDHIETEVRNGVLHVGFAEGSYSPRTATSVHVWTPQLEAISVSGSADVEAWGVNAHEFEVSLSGSGDIAVEGRTEDLHVDLTGSGDIDLEELASYAANVRLVGSGDIFVFVADALDVSISGSGDVHFEHPDGETPRVTTRVSGSGEVHGD